MIEETSALSRRAPSPQFIDGAEEELQRHHLGAAPRRCTATRVPETRRKAARAGAQLHHQARLRRSVHDRRRSLCADSPKQHGYLVGSRGLGRLLLRRHHGRYLGGQPARAPLRLPQVQAQRVYHRRLGTVPALTCRQKTARSCGDRSRTGTATTSPLRPSSALTATRRRISTSTSPANTRAVSHRYTGDAVRPRTRLQGRHHLNRRG